MSLTLLNWLLALSPVLLVLVLMLGLRWGGSKAGAAGWLAAAALAALYFGAGPRLLAYTQVKGALLTLDVLYIIWMALLFFQVADEAGVVRIIGDALPLLTPDRTLQGLLLGWAFVSFLQGTGGFGVSVAVVAPLLIGLGFNPIQAILMASLGHGWAVNFGSMALAFQTLMAVTNLPGLALAGDAAILLGIACLICGLLVALVAGGWRGMGRNLAFILILSLVMSGVQYGLVTGGLWTLGATGAAMAGMLAGVLLARLPGLRLPAVAGGPSFPLPADSPPAGKRRSWAVAISAYVLLVALAFVINTIQPVHVWFNQWQLELAFPELRTAYGWTTPAEAGRSISLFGHPGAILFYASLLSFLIFWRWGYYRPGALKRIARRVLLGAVKPSLGIFAMAGMATMMAHSGMTNLLAEGLSQSFGRDFYPLVSPFIGALGAFISGSNNNSNVLFAPLQQRTAELLGLSATLILAAQTTGAALGSVIAPAKVIVGCSTVGLGDQEGYVLRRMAGYALLPIVVTALAVKVWTWLF